jgi:hypothetical protein
MNIIGRGAVWLLALIVVFGCAGTGKGNIDPLSASYAMTNVREIWSPDNQLYGYIIH